MLRRRLAPRLCTAIAPRFSSDKAADATATDADGKEEAPLKRDAKKGKLPGGLDKMPKTGVLGVGRRILARGAQLPDGYREMLALCIVIALFVQFLKLLDPFLPFEVSDSETSSAHSEQEDIRAYVMVPVYEEDGKTLKHYRQVHRYTSRSAPPRAPSPF